MHTGQAIYAAIDANNGHRYFDNDLQPVQPKEGQRFCEVHVDVDYEGDLRASYEELVEYVGEDEQFTFGPNGETMARKVDLFAPEGDEGARSHRGDALILQS